jgi:ribosomal protein S18 acetylase RimI-like enzyme
MPGRILLADLDQRPEMTAAVLALLGAGGPGGRAVAGWPAALGTTPEAADLRACAGVLIALERIDVLGALAICPYSDTQVTWWGPATAPGARADHVARLLADEARRAAHDGGFTSLRVLCDRRDRTRRQHLLTCGFAPWKDTVVCVRDLAPDDRLADLDGVRTAARDDHAGVALVLADGFPESDHCLPNLVQREEEGYRHYLLAEDGEVVAAAAVQVALGTVRRRSWLKLLAVRTGHRGRHLGRRLLRGVIAAEARRGAPAIGLDVLADNAAALALYRTCGFRQDLVASVLVAAL